MDNSDRIVPSAFCAYKAIPISGGLMFLFEEIDREGFNLVPQINFFEDNIYLHYGRNILLLTEDLLSELIYAPFIVFARSRAESYTVEEVISSCAIDQIYIARLQGALEAFTATGHS